MVPARRLWLTLCVVALPTVAAGFVPGLWPAVLLLDAALLGLGAADWWLARATTLEVWRELPTRLQVGVVSDVKVHVVNPGGRRVLVQLKDDVPDALEPVPTLLEATVPARSRAALQWRAKPQRRGRFELGDVHLRIRGPFGFAWHQRVVAQATALSVFPDMRGASRLLLSDAALDLVNLGLRQLRRDGRGSEFSRLRDYAQGDTLRDVDWKATARRGRPVTRVMESERCQTVLIGVDAGRSMAAQAAGLTKLDHAVNAALFLAFVAIRNGDRVGLVVFADGVKSYLPPAAGRTQYRKMVDALYSTKPHLAFVDYVGLFKELDVRLTRRSLLAVFTDFLDEDQASTMVEPMRRLAKRHVPVCLSVKDVALTTLLETRPPDVETAYQHAVASELLLERETLKRKVGQHGVRLLDVDPEQLSLAAVNAYLEIKARGAL